MATSNKGFLPLKNSERSPVAGAARIGPADAKENLTVSVRVRRRQDGPAIDTRGLARMASGRRKSITREDYANSYGAAQSDLTQIATFAKNHGLKVVESSAARRTVVLGGTAEQLSSAFG